MQSSNSPSCQCDHPDAEVALLFAIAEDLGMSPNAIQSFSARVAPDVCFYIFAFGKEAGLCIKAAQDAYDHGVSVLKEPKKDQNAEQRPFLVFAVDDNDQTSVEIAQRFCREYEGAARTALFLKQDVQNIGGSATALHIELDEDKCECDALLLGEAEADENQAHFLAIFGAIW